MGLAGQRTCCTCGHVGPDADFVRRKGSKDGYRNRCKSCESARSRARTAADPERENARTRAWKRANRRHVGERNRIYRAEHVEHEREYRRRYKAQNAEHIATYNRERKSACPDKFRATNAVNNAIRDGRLVKGPCTICGSTTNVHGHHEDYAKPLDVVWLCPACHSKRHAQLAAEAA